MPITPSPAVLRACDVLSHLARHPDESFSVSELARLVGVPRATCDAILQALAVHRYVTRRRVDRRYQLGPGSITVGDAARKANPMLESAKDEAEELARASGSCVAVCIRDGDAARVADVFDFAPLFAVRARVGQTIPLVPPFGAVFVAWSDDESDAWLGRADATLKRDERARFQHALREVRRRGYSLSVLTRREPELRAVGALASSNASHVSVETRDRILREMMHSDYLAADLDPETAVRVAHVSAPVFDRSGRVTTSLLQGGPDYEVRGAELETLARGVVQAASRATRRHGGSAWMTPPEAEERRRHETLGEQERK